MNRLEEAKSRLLGIQELAPQPGAGAAGSLASRRPSPGAAPQVASTEVAPSGGATREFIA